MIELSITVFNTQQKGSSPTPQNQQVSLLEKFLMGNQADMERAWSNLTSQREKPVLTHGVKCTQYHNHEELKQRDLLPFHMKGEKGLRKLFYQSPLYKIK